MPHWPDFPPIFGDWKPAPPPFIPIPTFFINPLTPEQRAALEEEFGPWAAGRTIGMLSPKETLETARTYARAMYEPHLARALGYIPRKAREPRVRKPQEPTIAEKLAPVSVLTPEVETRLTDTALDAIMIGIETKHRRPNIEEIQEYVKEVIVWAEMEGVTIREAEAKRIVDNALARVDAELARRAPARRARL